MRLHALNAVAVFASATALRPRVYLIGIDHEVYAASVLVPWREVERGHVAY